MYKVLVVDDKYAICEGLQILIDWENAGYRVPDYALNGLEAMEKLKSSHYDVLITDIRMPGIDGIELIKKTREDGNPIKIVVLSGYKDFEYARVALENQVVNYILKPVNEQVLIDTLMGIKADMEEKLKNEIAVSRSAAIVREKIFQDLVKPDDRNLLAYWRAKEHGIKLDGFRFTVCVVKLDEYNEDESYKDHGTDWVIVKNIAYEIIEKEDRGYIFELEQEKIGIILYFEPENSLQMNDLCMELLQCVRNFCKTSVSIARGSSCHTFKQLPESYSHACKALELKFFTGGNRIITFEEVAKLISPASSSFRWNLDGLLEEVKSGSASKIEFEIDQLFERIISDRVAVRLIYGILVNVFMELAKMLDKVGGNLEDILSSEYQLDYLRKVQTADELQRLLKNACLGISNYLESIRSRSSNRVADAVKKYIQEHSDEDMNLKSVSKVFYMNPAYLGRLFKNTFETGFTEYLNDCRIDSASRLLEMKDIKVLEVCRHVGYKDMNHFYMQFKNRKGMTPSEYRKQFAR